MEFLKTHAPVFLSPRFWGLAAYVVLAYLQAKGWIGGEEIEALTQLIMLATGVGVVDSVARKIGGTTMVKK